MEKKVIFKICKTVAVASVVWVVAVLAALMVVQMYSEAPGATCGIDGGDFLNKLVELPAEILGFESPGSMLAINVIFYTVPFSIGCWIFMRIKERFKEKNKEEAQNEKDQDF